MYNVLNIATIMICTSIMTLAVGMALGFMWIFERREKAVAIWCLSMWVGTLASLFLAFRGVAPDWFGLGLGNAVALAAYGLIWAGFATFAGRRVHWLVTYGGFLAWMICYFGFETVRDNVNYRVIAFAAIVSFYCGLVVREALANWRAERLPSQLAAICIYASHGLFYFFRIPFTWLYPMNGLVGAYQSQWYILVTLEAFVHGIFVSYIFLSLIRERTERRYRLAAEIDALTGAASRRFFVSETRARLAHKPETGVLAVLDLDFFKRINDTYGHMAGDKVLQAFGGRIAQSLDRSMMFGRLGGEEFGLFLPDMTEEEAAEFLDALRLDIEEMEIVFMGSVIKITTSIGAATIAEAGLDFDHLMAAADNALYMAKHEGRNQIAFFHPALRIQKIVEAGRQSRVSLSKNRVSRLAVRSHTNRR